MSTLNSLTGDIHGIVFNNKKPSVETIIELGFDVEILENMITSLKPSMDYMRGYKSLTELFEVKDRTTYRFIPFAAWLEEFGEAKKYPHCIEIFHATMWGGGHSDWFPLIPSEVGKYKGEHQPRYTESAQRWAGQKVFLTRKGRWIIWTSYPTSVFRVVDTPRAALDMLAGLTPTGITMRNWTTGGAGISQGKIISPALFMAGTLSEFFRTSIADKAKDVADETTLLEVIAKPFNTFT